MGNVNEKITNDDDLVIEESFVLSQQKSKEHSGEKVMTMCGVTENGVPEGYATPLASKGDVAVNKRVGTRTFIDPRSPSSETIRTPIVYKTNGQSGEPF